MTTATDVAEGRTIHPKGNLGGLMLGALGVVYGDIGTSPLYTLKTALDWAGGATAEVAIGMLSLIVWTLIITTSVKYVAVVMRADNDGEGGILALMSLLGIKHGERVVVIGIGILGAALLYGDGAITPAISVLSALEGLKTPVPSIAPYIVALSAAVLIGLFALQSQGTDRIGKLFGPIMTIWFVTIGLLGLGGILKHPGVLVALDPRYGFIYLFSHGFTGFLVLGAVFLCATGAEALYADMGHFGPRPIRFAWYGLVLPMLLLNYAGQTAVVVDRRGRRRRQSVFHVVSAGLAGGAGRARDDRHHHRQPIDHQRRLFHDAAGDPAWTMSAAAHRADLGRGLRPDLYRLRQLDLDDPDARPDARLSIIRQPCRGLRHRRVADHAADLGADVHGDARNLGLEAAAGARHRRGIRHRRSVVRQRQSDESAGGRLVPAGRRRADILFDDHVAAGPRRAAARAGARHASR